MYLLLMSREDTIDTNLCKPRATSGRKDGLMTFWHHQFPEGFCILTSGLDKIGSQYCYEFDQGELRIYEDWSYDR